MQVRRSLLGLSFTVSSICLPAVAVADPGEGFQVERYEVALRPDVQSGAISVHEVMRIEATIADLRSLVFSPNSLDVADARMHGEPLTVISREDGIEFVLPQALTKGDKAELSFSLTGFPRKGTTLTPAGMHTGYFTCDWMVCLQNSPGDKADLHLDLYLPAELKSVGVGERYALIELEDGLQLHRYRSLTPTSAYLFGFAAGRYLEQSLETPHGTLRYLDATGEHTPLVDQFDETPAMVTFFANRAGLDLPGRAYAQVLVPGREAQETMSFSLIGKGELDREGDDPTSAWVIAHELAHQWWGNSVTSETWRDFWLNEGFATFMVAAWKEHRFGEAAYQQELDVFRNRRKQLQERGWDRPLTWNGDYPSLAYRRAVQYSKGALFLATLRETIGDEAFWRGVRSYTRLHDGGTVTSADFQRAMEKASGRDLLPLFDEWVYGGGRFDDRN